MKKNQMKVAVIPARGGSKGIPRKNARLMAGKPLLSYSILAAKKAGCFDAIYVSTDDPELAEIAKRYGAEVLERRVELAGDAATLDEVIADVSRQLVAERSLSDENILATLQPTSPLLNPTTISHAIDLYAEGDCDTVLTCVDEPHLAWTIRDDKAVPLYEARLNRQQLPAYMRETGGIVVCSIAQAISGSRFGSRAVPLAVSKEESIDIDDFYDWWMAEKALSRKKILFHVVGSRDSGLGHVYRALTLADRLPGHDLSFLVNSDSKLAQEVLGRRYSDVTVVEPGKELDAILSISPDLVINDVLDTEKEYMKQLSASGIRTVNFEDQGEGSLHASMVINALYDDHPAGRTRNMYYGAEYCCLRDEFYSLQHKQTVGPVKNILILFGGTDPSDCTLRVTQWMEQLSGEWTLTVVTGPGYKSGEQLSELIESYSRPVEWVKDTSVISRYMAEADIAVTSAGRTVFELGALGVPMVVVAHNEREKHHVFATRSPGVIYIGPGSDLSVNSFSKVMTEMLASPILRAKMHQALVASDLRGGIDRVLNLIETCCADASGKED